MASQPPHIRTVQATTILVSTAVGSLNLGLSFFVIPRLLESPTPLMLQQWNNMFRRTSRLFPGPMILSGVAFYYVSYALRALPAKSRLFALAGTLCISVTPWTQFLMMGINKKLFKKVEETKGMGIMAVGMRTEEEEGAKMLVDQWGLYNLGRGAAVLLGGVVGLFATLF